MIQNVAEVRANRGNFVKLGMRVLPDLTVVHDCVADLAGCTGAGRAVMISDKSPGLAFNVLPCAKLDHFEPHLQGKLTLTEMQKV